MILLPLSTFLMLGLIVCFVVLILALLAVYYS